MAIIKYKNADGQWESVDTPGALKFTEQALTAEEQAQARANIGVEIDAITTETIDALFT